MVIYPEYIDLNYWAAQLVANYPNENLPILDNEDKWREWAMTVISSGTFAKVGIPAPFSIKEGSKKEEFSTWQEWAKIVYTNMMNEKFLDKGLNKIK